MGAALIHGDGNWTNGQMKDDLDVRTRRNQLTCPMSIERRLKLVLITEYGVKVALPRYFIRDLSHHLRSTVVSMDKRL